MANWALSTILYYRPRHHADSRALELLSKNDWRIKIIKQCIWSQELEELTKQLAECQHSLQDAQTGLSGTSDALKGLVDVLGTHLRIPDEIQQALLSNQSAPVQHSVQQLPSLVSGFSSHDKPSTVKCTICIWWHPHGEYSRLSSCKKLPQKSRAGSKPSVYFPSQSLQAGHLFNNAASHVKNLGVIAALK